MIDWFWLKIMPAPNYPTEWPTSKGINAMSYDMDSNSKDFNPLQGYIPSKIYPDHEPTIKGGSPSIDYADMIWPDHNPVGAKNAHSESTVVGASKRPINPQITIMGDNYEHRTFALRLAYDALMPRVFGNKQPRLNDLKELYELAEYNVRFILNEDINLECMSQDEKLRKVIDKYK